MYTSAHTLHMHGANFPAAGAAAIAVPTGFPPENQAARFAVADLKGDGTQDLIVFMIDNPPGQNRGVYQIGHGLDANGNVTGG